MSGLRWSNPAATMAMAAAIAVTIGLVALPPAARAQDPAPAAPATTLPATAPAPASALALGNVNTLLQAIREPNGLPISRDEAARRLVARQSEDEAAAAIEIGLMENNRPGQLAIARALADDPQVDPRFLDELATLLEFPETAEAATVALVRFPEERPRLLGIATDLARRDVRPPVIKGLGTATDRRTVATLAALLTNANEPVRNAAADALARVTGQRTTARDRDFQRWQQWWAANQQKNDADFEADLLATRSNRLERERADYERLAAETRVLLDELYRRTPEADRPNVLVSYLRSAAPEARLVGVRLIHVAFASASPIAPAARDQMRALVGDSASEVRLQVATLIGIMNDAAALEPLLQQVVRERDPAVREAQAAALGPIGDLRAVDVLLHLVVNDRSPVVAEAAAESIRSLGPKLRAEQPAKAEAVAATLGDALRQPAAGNNDAVRVALLEAIAPLQSQNAGLHTQFRDLIKPNQPPAVRAAAARAMGALGADWAADAVLDFEMLADDSVAVRDAAVDALRTSADVRHADRLNERLSPVEAGGEPNPAIRQKIWNVLAGLFPRFRTEDLNRWADKFKEPTPEHLGRRLTILLQLKAKLQAMPGVERQLAVAQQNIGEAYAKLGQFPEAAAELQAAMDWYRQNEGEAASTQQVVGQLLDAHLQTKNYERATAFAAQQIAISTQYQDRVGPRILDEAKRLQKASDFEGALHLIKQARAMKPPLAELYLEDLDKIEKDVQQRVAGKAQGAVRGAPAIVLTS